MPHVLIVDDQYSNIDALAALLAREGVTHSTASNPRQVAAVLDEVGEVDAVFLDLEYPNDNGFESLADLRGDHRLDGVPIVAYSVHTSEVQVAREHGFDGFLGKPLDVHRFPEQLAAILSGEAVWHVIE